MEDITTEEYQLTTGIKKIFAYNKKIVASQLYVMQNNMLSYIWGYNVCILHALFDQYLLPDTGNNPLISASFFVNQVKGYKNGFLNNLVDILQNFYNRLQIYNSWNQVYLILDKYNLQKAYNLLEYPENLLSDLDKLFTNIQLNFELDPPINILVFKNKFTQITGQTQIFNMTNLIPDLTQEIFISKNNIQIPEGIFIISSGFIIAQNIGHQINFLVIPDKNNGFETILFNSGRGLELYHNKNQGMVKNILNSDQIKKLIIGSILFINYIYTDVSNFYEFLNNYIKFDIKNNINNSDPIFTKYQIDIIPPQLSGSCTYFSTYYLIKYYIFRYYNPAEFYLFEKYNKQKCAQELYNYIENYPGFPDIWKNFLDLLADIPGINLDINKLYKKYYKSVQDYIIFNPQIKYTENLEANKLVQKNPDSYLDLIIYLNNNFDNILLGEYLKLSAEIMVLIMAATGYNYPENNYTLDIILSCLIFGIIKKYKLTDSNYYAKLDINIITKTIFELMGGCWVCNGIYLLSDNKSQKYNSFFWVLLLILIKLDQAQNNLFEKYPGGANNLFKLLFYGYYGSDTNKFTELLPADLNLLEKYYYLFDNNLILNKFEVDLSDLINKLKFKNKYLIGFLLIFNPYIYITRSVNIFINNIIIENFSLETQKISLISSQGGYIKLSKMDMPSYNPIYHNYISIINSEINILELNKLITNIESIFDNSKIYDNFLIPKNTDLDLSLIYQEFESDPVIKNNYYINNYKLFLDFNKLNKIFDNFNLFSDIIILFILNLLVTLDFTYIYNNRQKIIPELKTRISSLKNNKDNNMRPYNNFTYKIFCFNLIINLLEPESYIELDFEYLKFLALDDANEKDYIYKKITIISYYENFKRILYNYNLTRLNLFFEKSKNYSVKLITDLIQKIYPGYNLTSTKSDIQIKYQDKLFEFYNFGISDLVPGYISNYFKKNYLFQKIKYNNTYKLISNKPENLVIYFEKQGDLYTIFLYYNKTPYKLIYPANIKNKFISDFISIFYESLICFYNPDLSEYFIYFIKMDIYLIYNSDLYFIISGEKYPVIWDIHPYYKKYIYNIPYCFIINNNNKYQILVLEDKLQIIYLFEKTIKNSAFITKNIFQIGDFNTVLSAEYSPIYKKNSYYLIDISDNCLIFNSEESQFYYSLLLMIYQKSDILAEISPIDLKTDYTNPWIGEFLIANGGNSPFNMFFKFIYNPIWAEQYKSRKNNYIYKYNYYKPANLFEEYQIKFPILKKSENISNPQQILYKLIQTNFYEEPENKNLIFNIISNYYYKILDILIPDKNQIKKLDISKLNFEEFDSQINICISEFKKTYNPCVLNPNNLENISQDLKFLTNNLNILVTKLKNYYLTKIYTDQVFENLKQPEIFIKYSELYYEIKLLKNIYLVFTNIQKILPKKNCSELKKILEPINQEIIYTREYREPEIILFELFFNYYIKYTQYKTYSKIYREIDYGLTHIKNPGYNLYQLLMGQGKTSVILILLLIRFIINPLYSEIKNIIILLPAHLIKQTYLEISKNYYLLTNYSSINILKNISRNQALSGLFSLADIKKIFLLDNRAIQAIKLNNLILSNNLFDIFKNNSIFIIDEFDSLYDPLRCELNYPIPNPNFPSQIKKSELINPKIYSEIINKIQADILSEKYNFNFGDSDSRVINKITNTYNICQNLIYNKDYGFPLDKSHTNLFISVPYTAVSVPIPGSYFSEIDINIILTSYCYFYSDLRLLDLVNIFLELDKIVSYFEKILEIPHIILLISQIYGLYITRIFFDNHYIIKNLNNNSPQLIKNIYSNIKSDFENNIGLKYGLLNNYLKNNIIGNLNYNPTQFNSSFQDIIGSNFSKYKIGFSGTLNLNLPVYQNPDFEFTGINYIKSDIGNIYIAILGLLFDNPKIFGINNNNINILELITDILFENSYNIFLDSGAFLKNHKTEDIIKKFSEKLKFIYYIFINPEDQKIIYNKNTNNYTNYSGEIFETDLLFIFYDNSHLIGQDIRQPFILRGLASVDIFNRFTDISQTIYRLRFLNFGHSVDFLLAARLFSEIFTRLKLLLYLLRLDRDYKNNITEFKKLIQNSKKIFRELNSDKLTSYQENRFNPYLVFKFKKEITGDIFLEYLENLFGEFYTNKTIQIIIKQIKLILDKIGLSKLESAWTESESELRAESEIITGTGEGNYQPDPCFFQNIQFPVKSKYLSGLLINNKLNIFLSSRMDFKSDFQIPNKILNPTNLLSAYYLKNNNKYIIINPKEAYYLKQLDPNNIIINKFGSEILNKKFEKNLSDYFVQYLLGGHMDIQKYLLILKYISESKLDKPELENILTCFEDLFVSRFKIKSEFFSRKYINLLNFGNFNNLLDSLKIINLDLFLYFLTGDEILNIKIPDNIQELIKKYRDKLISDIQIGEI